MQIRTFLSVAACCAAMTASAQGYELAGTTGTQLEGVTIYLSNKYTNYAKIDPLIEDSAVVHNGRFSFTGKLMTPAALVSVVLKKPAMGIRQFFLENRRIGLDIKNTETKNQLDSSTLTNAPIDEQNRAINERKQAAMKKMHALVIEMTNAKNPGDSQRAAWDNARRLIDKEETDAIISYLKDNPDHYAAFFWFAYHVVDRTIRVPEQTLALLKLVDPALQRSPEGKAVLERINNKLATASNNPLPTFSIPDVNGERVSSDRFRNNYLLIDFWASWCAPCVADIPNVKKVYEAYRAKNLSIISISLDDDKVRWLNAVSRYALPWTQVSELKGWNSPFAKQLDIRYIPQYYLVGPDGKFVLSGVSIAEVEEFMRKL